MHLHRWHSLLVILCLTSPVAHALQWIGKVPNYPSPASEWKAKKAKEAAAGTTAKDTAKQQAAISSARDPSVVTTTTTTHSTSSSTTTKTVPPILTSTSTIQVTTTTKPIATTTKPTATTTKATATTTKATASSTTTPKPIAEASTPKPSNVSETSTSKPLEASSSTTKAPSNSTTKAEVSGDDESDKASGIPAPPPLPAQETEEASKIKLKTQATSIEEGAGQLRPTTSQEIKEHKVGEEESASEKKDEKQKEARASIGDTETAIPKETENVLSQGQAALKEGNSNVVPAVVSRNSGGGSNLAALMMASALSNNQRSITTKEEKVESTVEAQNPTAENSTKIEEQSSGVSVTPIIPSEIKSDAAKIEDIGNDLESKVKDIVKKENTCGNKEPLVKGNCQGSLSTQKLVRGANVI